MGSSHWQNIPTWYNRPRGCPPAFQLQQEKNRLLSILFDTHMMNCTFDMDTRLKVNIGWNQYFFLRANVQILLRSFFAALATNTAKEKQEERSRIRRVKDQIWYGRSTSWCCLIESIAEMRTELTPTQNLTVGCLSGAVESTVNMPIKTYKFCAQEGRPFPKSISGW